MNLGLCSREEIAISFEASVLSSKWLGKPLPKLFLIEVLKKKKKKKKEETSLTSIESYVIDLSEFTVKCVLSESENKNEKTTL